MKKQNSIIVVKANTMATSYTYSEIFCCGNCHDAVTIEELPGGDLAYCCKNAACQKAVSVDCPESLALIEDVVLKLPVKRSASIDIDARVQTKHTQQRGTVTGRQLVAKRRRFITLIRIEFDDGRVGSFEEKDIVQVQA